MRVGLVLGAGGVLGGAWTAGALHALATETGWDPATADYIVGTSAGSVMATMVAAGVPPNQMLPDSPAELFADLIAPSGALALAAAAGSRFQRLPLPIPGSLRLTVTSLRQPRSDMLRLLSGLLPRGFFSTEPIKATVAKAVPFGWVGHPNCWIVACDYASGKRVVFGRPGAPPAEQPSAVAASCAIPGFYCPERIGGRLYVDGGLHSMSNLDLLAGLGLDLVICLNPMSSRAQVRTWDPLGRFSAATRRLGAYQVDKEKEKLQAGGSEVMVVEPGPEDLVAIGHNLMNARRRNQVLEVAVDSVTRLLQQPALRAQLSILSEGSAPAPALSARRHHRAPSTKPMERLAV